MLLTELQKKRKILLQQRDNFDMHLAAAVSWFLASDAPGSTRRAFVAINKRLATVDTPRSEDTTSAWTAESPAAAAALAASNPVSTKSSYARLKRCDAGAT